MNSAWDVKSIMKVLYIIILNITLWLLKNFFKDVNTQIFYVK